jgi:putative endopeptidase
MDELADFICDPVRSYSVPTFIGMGNGNDLVDSSKYILYIGTDPLTLGDAAEYKERTELGNLYYSAGQYLTTAMLTRIGYTEQEAAQMFDDSIALETKLAEHAFTNAEQMSPDYIAKVYNIYSKEELEEASPAFPMTRFLNALGYGKATEYLVAQPQVIQSINEIYTTENLDAIKNYMIVSFARDIADSLDREAYEASNTASNMLNGTEGTLPDERVAFGIVNSMLSIPMNRAYLEKYDATETKERITELIHQVVDVYRDMLREEDWLSEETKAFAIEKLDNLKINAVYPDKWLDCSSLNLKGLSYLECQKAISDFSLALDVSHVNGRVDKELWSANILDANAYYNSLDNSINIILGLLGGDFYHDGMSDEELFGGIGAVIGHEISHAFDTNGAQFDKDGNYANWWKDEDYAAFQERAAKLIDYYNERTIWEGANFFGDNIQTEAIADMAGLKAMLKLAEGKENFDYEKFFQSYASIWKEILTYEYEYYCYAQDTHPVSYLRTNATVQQFDEFLKTFDVKEGDNMYLAPEDRVLVW